MTSLQNLPTELLRRIASFLTCSAALNLIRVNHRIRAACNDRLVFQAIALNTRQHRVSWRDADEILDNASLQETIRIAYAVDQAFWNAEAEDALWGLKTPDQHGETYINEWLPHMLALRHPAALSLGPESLLHVFCRFCRVYQEDRPLQYFPVKFLLSRFRGRGRFNSAAQVEIDRTRDKAEMAAHLLDISFSIAALTLESLQWATDQASTFVTMQDYIKDPDFDPNHGLGAIISNCMLKDLSTSYSFHAADAAPLPIALIWVLYCSGALGSMPLPVPSRMPFSIFMHIPRPYSSSGQQFSTCYLAKMTQPDFLCGRWMGFYTDHRFNPARMDPPMVNINLISRSREPMDRPAQNIVAMVDRSSMGQDGCGHFRLFGEVYEDGHVEIAKIYLNNGPEWMWKGRIMPFGIMGDWSSLVSGHFGGHFWIWKEDWCATSSDTKPPKP